MTITLPASKPTPLSPAALRHVFAAWPSGVVALAAETATGPVGMVASSFVSVSLDPPLVSVCVATESRTWPELRGAARIGVSVLGEAHQEESRRLSARDGDRFGDGAWRRSRDGALFLEGSAAWLDCSLERQIEAGDHWIALLRIHDLDADHAVDPLVFHGSRYRSLRPRETD